MAVKTKVIAENTGQPNVRKLIEQHRLDGYKNPFDPNPNPQKGHCLDPKTGMRVGLDPVTYLQYLKKDSDNPDRKPAAPRLTDEERKVMDAFAKNPKGLPEELKPMLAKYLAP